MTQRRRSATEGKECPNVDVRLARCLLSSLRTSNAGWSIACGRLHRFVGQLWESFEELERSGALDLKSNKNSRRVVADARQLLAEIKKTLNGERGYPPSHPRTLLHRRTILG